MATSSRFDSRAVALAAACALGLSLSAVSPAQESLPATMQAVRMHEWGGAEVLRYEDAPRPDPGPGEVLVRVHATSVNPVDWKIRNGGLKSWSPGLPKILGFDVAGVVAALGSGVERLKVGDEVYGLLSLQRDGACAQYAVAAETSLALKPKQLDFNQAAAVPLAALTAYQALFDQAGLEAGQTVLVHAAAGGVGHFAVQLAKQRGAKVIATASARNHEFLRSMGADQVIDYQTQRFEEHARGVDVVLDSIGGDTQERSLQVLKPGGFLVSIVGAPSKAALEKKGLRGAGMLVSPNVKQLEELARLLDEGHLAPEISTVLPLSETRRAHELSETGHTRGKIVIEVIAAAPEKER
jgi:NADPH:quinone reductase-like Zn-dependent oxidoreductase